jgi:hypothetical protein
MNLLGDVLPDSIIRRDDGALEITDGFELAWEQSCKDLDRDHTKRMLSRFVPQSAASYVAPSAAPDRTHPTTYILAAQEFGRLGGCAGSVVGGRRLRRSLTSRSHGAAFSA